jgi:hypothetical protein
LEETFDINQDINENLEFYGRIPQDFNIDIEVSGEINGINPGDSKFLGHTARFVTSG